MEKYQEGNNYYSILVIKISQAGPSVRSYFFSGRAQDLPGPGVALPLVITGEMRAEDEYKRTG